jgi:hypothetical protein
MLTLSLLKALCLRVLSNKINTGHVQHFNTCNVITVTQTLNSQFCLILNNFKNLNTGIPFSYWETLKTFGTSWVQTTPFPM